jgi:broad specificity phosphatase PhoE
MTGPLIIPSPTLQAIQETSVEQPLILLIRHSARGPIPPGEPGNDVLLLPEGKILAQQLGQQIGDRLRTLRASPVLRCMETAISIAEGAGRMAHIIEDKLLGDPGVYLIEGKAAWETWKRLGHEQVLAQIVAGIHLDGLADPIPASRRLMKHMFEQAGGEPGIHVFVTHDMLVTAAAAHTLQQPLGTADWPAYLEALVMVDQGNRVIASYRGWSREVRWT